SEEAAVQRELAEEAGYTASRLIKLCTFDTSKSILDETAHLYMAENLRAVERVPDDTEFIEARACPFDEEEPIVDGSEIFDGTPVVAVLHVAVRRGSNGTVMERGSGAQSLGGAR